MDMLLRFNMKCTCRQWREMINDDDHDSEDNEVSKGIDKNSQ